MRNVDQFVQLDAASHYFRMNLGGFDVLNVSVERIGYVHIVAHVVVSALERAGPFGFSLIHLEVDARPRGRTSSWTRSSWR